MAAWLGKLTLDIYHCHIYSIVMSLAIAITSNWQMHIPRAMRVAAGLSAPGIVMATVGPGEITIRPQKSKIMSLAGSLRTAHLKNPVDIDNIRDYIDYSQA